MLTQSTNMHLCNKYHYNSQTKRRQQIKHYPVKTQNKGSFKISAQSDKICRWSECLRRQLFLRSSPHHD